MNRGQHADAPLKLTVSLAGLVRVQHALKDKSKVARINRQSLIIPVDLSASFHCAKAQYSIADLPGSLTVMNTCHFPS